MDLVIQTRFSIKAMDFHGAQTILKMTIAVDKNLLFQNRLWIRKGQKA
jgi:hypothetical protein